MVQRLVDGLDLLVLNPQVKQAADLISTLRRCQPRLKVVALVASDEGRRFLWWTHTSASH
jgi:hypothetical protein